MTEMYRPRLSSLRSGSGRTLQALVAFAVIAAALLDPLQAAISVAGLVDVVLVEAAVHTALAGGFLGVFRIHRRREYRVAHRHRRGGGSGRCCGRGSRLRRGS